MVEIGRRKGGEGMNREAIWGTRILSRGKSQCGSLEAGAAGGQCGCPESSLEGEGLMRSDK